MCDPSRDLTLAGLSVKCSAHVDDIRTCCVGVENVNEQTTAINMFVASNSLALNTAKTFFTSYTARGIHQPSKPNHSDKKVDLKYLNVWWCQERSQLSKTSIRLAGHSLP